MKKLVVIVVVLAERESSDERMYFGTLLRCLDFLHNDAASFAIFTEDGKYSSIMASVTLSLYFALSINKAKQVLYYVACKLLHDVSFDLYVNPRSVTGFAP